MDLDLLKELKHRLLHDKQLNGVWIYFMDHFADHVEFVQLGMATRHSFLESVLEQVSKQMFADDGAVSGVRLVSLGAYSFIHGGFAMGGRYGGLIYFEDVYVGLIAVPDKPPSNEMKYARFTGRALPPMAQPSKN